MANGYASNIPIENASPEPELLPANVCVICKRRPARSGDDGMCATCAKALA
ncbi:MAG TPA: hypothetical protein VM370_01925 [Candidatus Thermoplasmatota archaeon]|nr:hypothetical protein [Candidatus Thermoplasmatota archaeon]